MIAKVEKLISIQKMVNNSSVNILTTGQFICTNNTVTHLPPLFGSFLRLKSCCIFSFKTEELLHFFFLFNAHSTVCIQKIKKKAFQWDAYRPLLWLVGGGVVPSKLPRDHNPPPPPHWDHNPPPSLGPHLQYQTDSQDQTANFVCRR